MEREDAWETLVRALDDVSRRRLLVALLERSASDEAVRVPEDVHRGDRELEALKFDLYHVHLPLLESADYVRWDRETHEVERGDAFDEIRPVLRVLHDNRDDLPDGWV
jgi:hypothetical protein